MIVWAGDCPGCGKRIMIEVSLFSKCPGCSEFIRQVNPSEPAVCEKCGWKAQAIPP